MSKEYKASEMTDKQKLRFIKWFQEGKVIQYFESSLNKWVKCTQVPMFRKGSIWRKLKKVEAVELTVNMEPELVIYYNEQIELIQKYGKKLFPQFDVKVTYSITHTPNHNVKGMFFESQYNGDAYEYDDSDYKNEDY